MCVCLSVCLYLHLYTYLCIWTSIAIPRSPENEVKKISFFLAFYHDLMPLRLPPDIGAKMEPWVTVGYHTDTICLEFQAVVLSSMLTVHALISLVFPAFRLGWSYGYVSWKMLPRMCSKALLSVRKSVPGNVWRATPKGSCSQVLAHLSFPSSQHLTSASMDSLVQPLLFYFLESQKSWKKLGLDKNLLASRKEVCRA